MSLHKVPGVKNYMADDGGLREIGLNNSDLTGLCMDGAYQIANMASDLDPRGTYDVVETTAPVGRNNELRTCAEVVQVEAGWPALKHTVMADVALAINWGRVRANA